MTEPTPERPAAAKPLALLFLAGAVAVVLVASGYFTGLKAGRAAPPAPSTEREVKAVLDAQVEAWNRGDLDGFMTGYWNDDELFFVSGGKTVRGYKALRERYDANYRGDGKEMGRLKFSELHVEPLGPDAALVRGRWDVVMKNEEVGGWFTLVMRRFPDGWKIVHDHTSK